jgi:plastocyanin
MKSSPSILVRIFVTIGILVSLTAASSFIIQINNFVVANAQPSVSDQPETDQDVDTIIRQGTVTSSQDPLPGHEGMQMATILPFRQDGSLYSGVLTYTSTAPVEVVILNMQTLNETERAILNATDADDGELGTLFMSQLDNQTSISASYIVPSYTGSPVPSASIPFVGNAVWLHTLDGTPFTATFAVNALVLTSQIQNIFNEPLETTDIDGEEGGEEGAEGDLTGDSDAGTTAGTETGEEGDALTAEEETSATSADEDDTAGTAGAEGNSEEVVVRIPQGSSSLTDDAYQPNPIEVSVGGTVTWVNDDFTVHTATSGTADSGSTGMFGGTDDSPELIGPEGDTQTVTFDDAGEFEYYCTLHPNMVGTVIVTES